jgi:hypothetical protein
MTDSVLSAELLAELGDDPDLVMSGSTTEKQKLKNEKKRARDAEPTEEVKEVVKQMSKRQKKRVEQIQKRKDRESKQSEYLSKIGANEITESQRQLLTSSRQLNQTLSLKQTVALLLKKERAGIALTEEERGLLYVKKSKDDDDFMDIVPPLPIAQDIIHGAVAHKEIPISESVPLSEPSGGKLKEKEAEEAAFFTMDDIFGTSNTSTATADDSKKKKKNKKKKSSMIEETMIEEEQDASKESSIVVKAASAAELKFEEVVELPNIDQKKKKKKKKNAEPEIIVEEAIEEVEQPLIEETVAVESEEIPAEAEFVTKKKKEKKNKKAVADSNENTANESQLIEENSSEKKSKFSLGKQFLQHFAKLKEKQQEKEEAIDEAATEKNVGEHDGEIAMDQKERIHNGTTLFSDIVENPDQAAYEIDETPMPVNELGEIVAPELTEEMKQTNQALLHNRRRTNIVRRPEHISVERMNLPVCQMEQEIVEAIQTNDVIILCSETGSGKSTQVPQFLYEAGYTNTGGLIGITQPRRVAVISTAERVNYEMGQVSDVAGNIQKQSKKGKKVLSEDTALIENDIHGDGQLVGYQIRYDSHTVGKNTKIKFMTDGILLREITQDILLRRYEVIILDEAHERNINTDILLGMISRTIPLRKRIAAEEETKYAQLSEEEKQQYAPPVKPLKLIIMSATLRTEDFQNPKLFGTEGIPPIIKIENRQYPVTTHFAKRTELRNYLQEVYKKVCQIHRKLPAGGILVFLTGKREILHMCAKLRKALGHHSQKMQRHQHAFRENSSETDNMQGGNSTAAAGESNKNEFADYEAFAQDESEHKVHEEEDLLHQYDEQWMGELDGGFGGGDGDQAEIDSADDGDDFSSIDSDSSSKKDDDSLFSDDEVEEPVKLMVVDEEIPLLNKFISTETAETAEAAAASGKTIRDIMLAEIL